MSKSGDRVELISTDDPYTRLRPGARGTVGHVDDLGTVHVNWDDGSRLGLVEERGDRWRVVEEVPADPKVAARYFAEHGTNGSIQDARPVRPKGWPNYPEEVQP
jgi:hypothetical protein